MTAKTSPVATTAPDLREVTNMHSAPFECAKTGAPAQPGERLFVDLNNRTHQGWLAARKVVPFVEHAEEDIRSKRPSDRFLALLRGAKAGTTIRGRGYMTPSAMADYCEDMLSRGAGSMIWDPTAVYGGEVGGWGVHWGRRVVHEFETAEINTFNEIRVFAARLARDFEARAGAHSLGFTIAR